MAYAPRILIIDDEAVVRRLFEAILAEDGYSVTGTATARHGLSLLQDTEFDLIIADMSLPDADGLDLIREIRHDFPHMKVLAVSGFMEGPLRQMAISAGATGTLGKPAAPGEVRQAVYRALDDTLSWVIAQA